MPPEYQNRAVCADLCPGGSIMIGGARVDLSDGREIVASVIVPDSVGPAASNTVTVNANIFASPSPVQLLRIRRAACPIQPFPRTSTVSTPLFRLLQRS